MSTHSQILVTDISLLPNSSHWLLLSTQFCLHWRLLRDVYYEDFGISVRRSSRLVFRRSTGNEVIGHYKHLYFPFHFFPFFLRRDLFSQKECSDQKPRGNTFVLSFVFWEDFLFAGMVIIGKNHRTITLYSPRVCLQGKCWNINVHQRLGNPFLFIKPACLLNICSCVCPPWFIFNLSAGWPGLP